MLMHLSMLSVRMGTFDFLGGRMEPNHITSHTSVLKLSICFQRIKQQPLTTLFQYKLMEHFTLWGLHGFSIFSLFRQTIKR